MSEVKEFYESFDVHIEEYLSGEDEEEIIESILESEMNHKHCNPNDPRLIYDETQISSLLEDTIEYLKTVEGRCEDCGKLLNDDEYITETQSHPIGETTCNETIVVGYKCSCGYEGRQ